MYLLYCRRVSGIVNCRICPKARFEGWALLGDIARTIYFQNKDPPTLGGDGDGGGDDAGGGRISQHLPLPPHHAQG